MIVQQLRAIQEQYGYLPVEQIVGLAKQLGEPLHRLHEVITFFPHFRLQPPPDVAVYVCRDQACHLRGAPQCLALLKGVPAEFGGESRVKIEGASCLGRCDGAPSVLIELHRKGEPDRARVLQRAAVDDYAVRLRAIVKTHLEGGEVPADPLDRSPRPWRIDPYQAGAAGEAAVTAVAGVPPASYAHQPYAAVRQFVDKLKLAGCPTARKYAGGVTKELRTAGLGGMGGAGRPAWTKWAEVRDESERADRAYIICNADESEPSTFKDREILLRAPHLVVEGMVLGALLVDARKGYVYVRHEYFDQIHAVEAEIERARTLGVIGPNVLGTGRSFELEVFESPGGYICGEQSALIEAIEERRAEPRNRPPMIEAKGLDNQPTLLNNVETFAWVPSIMLNGGAWYRDSGIADTPWYVARRKPGDQPRNSPRGKGMRFFSICGDVTKPGVYEIPVGLTIGELIALAGGMRDGLPLLAFAPSGPSGGLLPAILKLSDLPPKRLASFPDGRTEMGINQLPLDRAELAALGLLLGAGLFVVAGRPGVEPVTQLLDIALNATIFFRNESCGKCVPCRLGSQKLVLIGERLAKGPWRPGERAELIDQIHLLKETMEQTSICSLGTSAPSQLASLIDHDWQASNRPTLDLSSPTAHAGGA
jgi:formate dehydrogenase beta subunit